MGFNSGFKGLKYGFLLLFFLLLLLLTSFLAEESVMKIGL